MPRPKGLPKTGGRQRGSLNKRTIAQQNQTKTIRQAAKEAGSSPLEYMLQVMRDPATEAQRRDEMAKAAAPYCHARLQVIQGGAEDQINDKKPINLLVVARQVALALHLADKQLEQHPSVGKAQQFPSSTEL
ncbi:MAG: hypothetical protein OES46_00125 [Gammaproteobacteria bacterium]|nr:hypothetical protein [Gammaproteobacteria bacterium]